MTDETEQHDKLVRFISARDRVTPEKAKAILNILSPPDLIMTEMQAANLVISVSRSTGYPGFEDMPHVVRRDPTHPGVQVDYDPCWQRDDYQFFPYRIRGGNSCLPEHSPTAIIRRDRGWYK
jgi:hypothetical protein